MEGILGRIIATILGLLALGGVIYLGTQAMGGSKSSQTVSDIAQVVNNAHAQFSQSSTQYTNFKTANAAGLISAGIFPADMVNGGALVDAWGNALTVAPGAANTEFQLGFGGGTMSSAECTKVATGLAGYVSMTIGTTTFTATPDAATAGTACAGATTFSVTFQ